MAPTKTRPKPDLFVMKLLVALAKVSTRKPAQNWISVDDLDLSPTHYLCSTIDRAVEAGWLSAGGKPAYSITITAEVLTQIV